MNIRHILALVISLPPALALAAPGSVPEQIELASTRLMLRLSCPPEHVRTYEMRGSSFRFEDVAGVGGTDKNESSKELDPERAADLIAALLSSTFPDLPGTVGDRSFLGVDGRIERFHVQVTTACSALLSFEAGGYSHSVSYRDQSLLPSGLLDVLQEFSGEAGEG